MYHQNEAVTVGLQAKEMEIKDLDESIRRVIECRIQFIKFCKIDIIGEQFRAKVIIKSRWKDYDTIEKYDPSVHWNPKLFIENIKTLPTNNLIEKISYKTEMFSNFTQITETREVTGDFWERMELQEYPLDTQELSVTICSYLGENEIQIIEDTERISSIHPRAYNLFEEQQKFMLHTLVKTSNEASYESESYNDHIKLHTKGNVFSAAVAISRRSSLNVLNNFSLVFIVTLLTFTTFADSAVSSDARSKTLFTLLLSLFAYKITTSAQIPSISYLTMIDKYMLLSICFTGSLALWFAFFDFQDYKTMDGKQIDSMAMYCFVVVFIFIQLFTVALILKSMYKIHKFLRKDEKNLVMLQSLPYNINKYDY